MKKGATIVYIAAVLLLLVNLGGVAGMMGLTGMMGHFGAPGGMMFGFPGALLMVAGWVLIVGALLVGAIWLARQANVDGAVSRETESPLDILKKRYAKGEVTKEEFDAIKKDLEA